MSRTETTCSRCDYKSTTYTNSAPLGHMFADDGDCTTAIYCTRTVNGCGNQMIISAKSHTYSFECDTTCNNSGCTVGNRTTSHGNWYYEYADNTEEGCVQHCGYCDVEYSRDRHDWTYDDNSCLTPMVCSKCEETNGTGESSHNAAPDDGDCTTPIKCTHIGAGCTQIVVAAKQHTYSAECDTTCNNSGCTVGNRTASHGNWYYRYADDTEEGCVQHCGYCDVEYNRDRHDWTYDDNSCLTPMVCSKCDRANGSGYTSHLAAHDDGNCLTAVKCTRVGAGCTQVVVAAKSSHSYTNACDPTCNNNDGTCTAGNRDVEHGDYKYTFINASDTGCLRICGRCDLDVGTSHVPAADDNNCTTATTCTNCEGILVGAHGNHTYEGGEEGPNWECTCSGCNYERPYSTLYLDLVLLDIGVTEIPARVGYSSPLGLSLNGMIDGYNFVGWTHAGGGTYDAAADTFTWGTTDATLTAQWSEYAKLTLALRGGLYEGSSGPPAIQQAAGTTITLANPTRDGYIFNGWYHDGDGSFDGSGTYTFGTSHATLTATWKAKPSSGTSYVSGIWTFNKGLVDYKPDETFANEKESQSATVSFSSNGQSFCSMSWNYEAYYVSGAVNKALSYGGTQVYHSSTAGIPIVWDDWSAQGYATVDFGTTLQEVPTDFYNWLVLNASPAYASYTVNYHFMDGAGNYSDSNLRSFTYSTLAGTEVTPKVDAYGPNNTPVGKQWVPPPAQTVLVVADGSTVIDYWYENRWYNVVFDGNGATDGSVASMKENYGTTFSLNANKFTRTGYEFVGWNTKKDGTGIAYADQASVQGLTAVHQGTATLYAQWDLVDYTITYDSNGGSAVAAQKYNIEDNVILAAAPTRTGYSFKGWELATATGNWSATTYSASQAIGTGKYENITLVAQWELSEVEVTIHHFLQDIGGTGWTEDTNAKQTLKATVNDILTLANLKQAFTGFTYSYGTVDGTRVATVKMTADGPKAISLYYTRNQYTVTLTAGTGVSSVSGARAYYYGETVSVNANVQSGYSWSKWTGDIDTTTKEYTFTMPASNVTMTAMATANVFYVTYDANGGTGAPAKQAFLFGSADPISTAIPSRTGYTFVKWVSDPNNQDFAPGDPIPSGWRSFTLVAQWEANTYSIVYNYDGGTAGANAPTSVTFDTGFNVSNPTRSDYVFAGWNVTGMDGTLHYFGVSSSDYNQSYETSFTKTEATWFKNLTAVAGDEIIFTAVWTSVDVEIAAVTLKYLDATGNMLTITDLTKVPMATTVYVYHTYTNNSGTTQTVNGYHNGSMISDNGMTEFTLAPGTSITVRAGSFMPALGENSITGHVYLDGCSYGDTSKESNGNNNSKSITYTVIFDVELVEIYLTDMNGNRLDPDNIIAGITVQVHHVYRNNSAGSISVDFYHNGTQFGSIADMASKSVQDVVAATITPSEAGSTTYSGALYRQGKNGFTETCESNLSNNSKTLTVTVVKGPELEFYETGAPLRVGADVFTSFTVANDLLIDFTPNNPLVVTLVIHAADGSLVKKMTQDVIVPAGETQLVWFRWTVPNKTGSYTFEATVEMPQSEDGEGNDVGYSVEVEKYLCTAEVIRSTDYFPPETSYEDTTPGDWTQPGKPSTVKDSASWTVWEWDIEEDAFVQVKYGVSASVGEAEIIPNSPTAYYENGAWHMKAGYSFSMSAEDTRIEQLTGCEMPSTNDYTSSQWCYAAFPEFKYMTSQGGVNYMASMDYVSGNWCFGDHDGYGRHHFVPVWYPDSTSAGNMYYVKVVQGEIWTPVGVLTVYGPSIGIWIEGDIYDDWYTS